jgi:hypothetical protein
MIVTQSKIYLLPSNAKTIRVARMQMLYMRALATGTITSIAIYLSAPLAPLVTGGTAEAIFNVRLNGSALFTGANKPTLADGAESVTKTGLSIAVNKFDVLVLDLESIDGRAGRSVMLMVDIDKP